LSFNWLDSGFLGALAGSLLTGLIAVSIMSKQLNYDKNKERKQELSNYIKAYRKIELYTGSISKGGEGILDLMRESLHDRENHELIFHLKLIFEDAKSYRRELKLINEDYIPEPIYSNFIYLQRSIDDIIYFSDRFINKEGDTIDPMEKVLEKLNKNLQLITNYTESEIQEFKKLK
jgi:hypothetical protein